MCGNRGYLHEGRPTVTRLSRRAHQRFIWVRTRRGRCPRALRTSVRESEFRHALQDFSQADRIATSLRTGFLTRRGARPPRRGHRVPTQQGISQRSSAAEATRPAAELDAQVEAHDAVTVQRRRAKFSRRTRRARRTEGKINRLALDACVRAPAWISFLESSPRSPREISSASA